MISHPLLQAEVAKSLLKIVHILPPTILVPIDLVVPGSHDGMITRMLSILLCLEATAIFRMTDDMITISTDRHPPRNSGLARSLLEEDRPASLFFALFASIRCLQANQCAKQHNNLPTPTQPNLLERESSAVFGSTFSSSPQQREPPLPQNCPLGTLQPGIYKS